MPASGFVRRDLNHLETHLADGETVDRIVSGTYDNANGILVLTDRRLLFLNHGILSQRSEDFPLEKISSVQFKGGMMLGEVTIYTSNQQATIKNVAKPLGKTFTDAVRSRGSAPRAAAPPDHAQQLAQLAELRTAGVLTEDEFAAKKAEILARM
ncbi:hypothetical protein CSIV_14170 [Microbacterium sp. CSI-V]|nr:hypothetical protein CSIV_14170 [Microbacterium sp. CSI-V]